MSTISRQDGLKADLEKEVTGSTSLKPSQAFLRFSIATLLVGAVSALVALRIVAPDQMVRSLAPLLVFFVALTGWYFLAHGRMQTTRFVLAFGIWVAVTGTAVFTDGVRAPVVVGYPILILSTAWLISARAAVVLAALTVAATVALVVAESWGLLPNSLHSSSVMYGGDQSVIYIVSTLLAVFLVRAYQRQVNELHKVGRDLTRRTLDLETSKSELDQAQAVASVGSWVYDKAADTMRLSAEACRMLGLPQDVSQHYDAYLARIHPDDRVAFDRAWQLALQGAPFDIECRILVDGAVRCIRQKIELVHATSGVVLGAMGISHDITERKLAQEAQRIAATAFESQQGMAITDAQRVILRVNKAFTRITGYGAEEAVGQTPRLLNSGRHDAAFFTAMTASLRQQGVWQGEIWNRRKNGEIYPEWLNISDVRDDAGQVTHYVAIFADISERKMAEEKINTLAFYDPLTHLPNRRLLMDRLAQTLTTSARHLRKSALLFIDLDNFKALNDTLGHLQGDVLLAQVAQRLLTCIREGDTAARPGSDEFVVILEDLGKNELEAATHTRVVGEKILAALNRDYQLDHGVHHSSASIGITLFGGGPPESSEEPLKRAELAMYQAKAAGRNTMRFFDPQMQVDVTTRATLEADLREAVLHRQFVLYFQAQVVGLDRVTGVEALVRWQHPQRGLVSPAEFIPLAEETGLILPLGQWVLESACAQIARWATRPEMAHLTIAVNVSARQFHQKDFVDQVLRVLAQTGADPRLLKLELTESMLVEDIEDVIARMSRLKVKGVSFSLDDFGTGYSSLAYLKRLPLDQLKIDQGFIRNIISDPNDAAIARMVIALAGSLGLSVIAEGVEIAAQREFLSALGCHACQGYLFSRPLPVAEFETYVQRHC